MDGLPSAFLVDPASLHILLVDASSTSRQQISSLLKDCSYQVTACKTSQEAIQLLKAQQGPEGTAGFDLILKEHSPASGTNACRLLRRAQTESILQGIPIIVASMTEDRDVMVSCLQLGAADYLLKPLRHKELRNLWARVYWWRRASYLQQQPSGSVQPNSVSTMFSQGSGGSDETKCCSDDDEPQEGMIGEDRSGEGSAPNGSHRNGSNGPGSGGIGSKDGSKEGLGWSKNQVKPGNGNSGDGNGNSATKAEQGSNHPSSDAGQAQNTSKFGNGNSGTGRAVAGGGQESPAQPVAVEGGVYTPLTAGSNAVELLRIAPLNVDGRLAEAKPEVKEAAPVTATGGVAGHSDARPPAATPLPARPMLSPPGFRAYVATENPRKRPAAEAVTKEENGAAHSSGSDRTASMEKQGSGKRRSIARLGNGPCPPCSEPMASEGTYVQARATGGTDGSEARQTTATNGVTNGRPSGEAGASIAGTWAPLPPGQVSVTSGFNAYYPYNVMPSPFAMPPQFWGQMSGAPPCSQADMNQMSNFFQYAQQGQGSKVAPGLQEQQMAMHNQLMFQHSILMQRYGMPAPPFAPFPNFSGQPSSQGARGQPAQAGSVKPQPKPQPQPQPGMQKEVSSANMLNKRNASSTWTPTPAREQSYPASGVVTATGTATGTGAANGNTLGTNGNGNGNGATSHTTAQVGPDGCMMEPSRKERRAQALYKYKQKRKNLCFTKKIRYESRKQLAQARPRVKGQFVRLRSDDVEEVVDAIAKAKDRASSGDAVVPQIALEKAGGNAAIAAELMEAATKLAEPGDLDNTEEEDYEEEDFEDEDVNSPAETKGRVEGVPEVAGKDDAPKGATVRTPGKAKTGNNRHSSNSGSNSPELNAAGVRL